MPEIQDIFNSVTLTGLSPDQIKAFHAIRNCRTNMLGAHVDRRNSCIPVETGTVRNAKLPNSKNGFNLN